MKKTLPIVFFSSTKFGIHTLKEFLKSYKPLFVITLPPKKKGRKLILKPNEVYLFCLKEKLPVLELKSFEEIKKELDLIRPLAGIVAGFGRIIPKEIIDLFPRGILNIHPSLLPKYRGPNPIRETILNGDKETGVTIFVIDELIDHGPIVAQQTIFLKGNETYLELEEILGKLGGYCLIEVVEKYINNKVETKPQDETKATYTRKISFIDGLLRLDEDYEIWERKIRALNPEPGTYLYITLKKESKILKVFSISKINENILEEKIKNLPIGSFFRFKNELGMKIKDTFIVIHELQLQDRKKMTSREFLNGYPLENIRLMEKN